jgi:hypothetical protein
LRETPELSSLPDSFRSRASIERFQRGLQIVLSGIEVELELEKTNGPDGENRTHERD